MSGLAMFAWPRPFRVPGYPLTPALFIAAAVAIVVNTALARPVQALVGLGIVATGVPVYLVWRWRAAAAGAPAPTSPGTRDDA